MFHWSSHIFHDFVAKASEVWKQTFNLTILPPYRNFYIFIYFYFTFSTRGMLVTTILWLATYAPSTTLNKLGAYESLSIHEK